MVNTFVFFPWDLNEFDFEVADLVFYFSKIPLHSIVLALVVAIDLTYYNL